MQRSDPFRVPRPRVPRPGRFFPPGPAAAVRRAGRSAPAARLLLSEGPRATGELAASVAAAPLLAAERRGDGHPVLVLPGLLGGDLSTVLLRRYLRWLGYTVSGWELGTNVGPTEAVVRGLRDRVARLADTSGRKVTLVGWSLGGLYAYELARRTPGSVRQVVTLGSPVRIAGRGGRTASRLLDDLSHLRVTPPAMPRPWTESGPLRVPATAVYTRSDGVVAWKACLLPPGRRRENVEVRGSHCGLAHNPTVLHVLADRLGAAEGEWRAFRPGPLLRPLYP